MLFEVDVHLAILDGFRISSGIYPYATAVDLTTVGRVFFNLVTDTERMQTVNSLIRINFGVNFTAGYVFYATWDRVPQRGGNITVSMNLIFSTVMLQYTHWTSIHVQFIGIEKRGLTEQNRVIGIILKLFI